MELVFLGHQSWLISHKSTNVLLDPLLLNSFGHCEAVNFEVYPPRTIKVPAMPRISAVILSHEHLDHFHLPSLDRLSREVPFYVSRIMPYCIVDAVRKLGFTVHEVNECEPFTIGHLELILYPGGPETIFWESRVHQVYAYPKEAAKSGVFIAVDALVSDVFKQHLTARKIPPMKAIVCANNSQVVPQGAQGAHTNLLPIPDRDTLRNPGVSLLHEILVRYLKGLPPVPHVILCGNGFFDPDQPFGPFLYSDNKRLAEIATELGYAEMVHGPLPGEALDLDAPTVFASPVSWIECDIDYQNQLLAKRDAFMQDPRPQPIRSLLGAVVSEEEYDKIHERIKEELSFIARSIMVAPVGKAAVATNEHLIGSIGSRRILFRFVGGLNGEVVQYALDINRAQFVPDDTPTELILQTFPYGVEMHMKDFAGVLNGELQIWDLAGTAMRSWYARDRYSNVICFLYMTYGEQVRPDLAAKIYDQAIERLGVCVAG
jgi:hypothetical protein